MIAIILPSRGLIHSRTVESVLRAADGYEVKFFFSHDRPIPDCFNEPIQEALGSNPSHIWIVEEDMEFGDQTLDDLIAQKTDIAFLDYNLVGGIHSYKERLGVPTGGTGCILIKTSAIKELLPLRIQAYDQYNNKLDAGIDYGGHDIDLFLRAHQKGFSIALCGQIDHLKVKEYGKPKTNNGCHNIIKL